MLDYRSLAPEIDEIQRRMEAAFRRLSGLGSSRPQYCSPVYEPPTDVFETSDSFVVSMEIAGIAGQQVEVQAEGERVTIRGNRLDRRESAGEMKRASKKEAETVRGNRLDNEEPLLNVRRILQLEVPFGAFARTLYLPATIDASEATARYVDGFLEMKLPKLPIRRQYLVRIAVE